MPGIKLTQCVFSTAVLFCFSAMANHESAESPDMESRSILRDVHYGDETEQQLDIVFPDEATTDPAIRPALIQIHGGAWVRGDKRDLLWPARRFAEEGIVVFNINYRLVRRGHNRWPACWEDTKSALAWIIEQAGEYGLDTNRIGVVGYSAGAHLATLLGTHPDTRHAICGMVDFFGPTGFREEDGEVKGKRILFGSKWTSNYRSMLRAASPVVHAGPESVPAMILHGAADRLVSVDNSISLYKALRANGVRAYLHIYPGEAHAFIRPGKDGKLSDAATHAWERAVAFLKRELGLNEINETGRTPLFGNPFSPDPSISAGRMNQPWYTIHGDASNTDSMDMQNSPRKFELEDKRLPLHVNWSAGVLHRNGLFYFSSTTQSGEADSASEKYLNAFDSRTGDVLNQTLIEGGAASAPMIGPDGMIYTVGPDNLTTWSTDLERLDSTVWEDAGEPLFNDESRRMRRKDILIPWQNDGAASMNYDSKYNQLHTISLCGRWLTFDLNSRKITRNLSLGRFVSNTVAVWTNGVVYFVGAKHEAVLNAYDQPLGMPGRRLLPRKYRSMTRREFLQSDHNEDLFLKALLLGKLLDAPHGIIGALIPGSEDGEYRIVEKSFQGTSETSPAIGRDGSLYICDGAGHLLAFSPLLAHLKWSRRVGPHTYGSVAVDSHNALYVVAGDQWDKTFLIRFADEGSGAREVWRLGGGKLRSADGEVDSPVHSVRSVFVTTTGGVGYATGTAGFFRRGKAFSIDLDTGRVLNQADYDSPGGFVACIPVSEERLVAFTADLLNLRNRRWPFHSEAGVRVYRRIP